MIGLFCNSTRRMDEQLVGIKAMDLLILLSHCLLLAHSLRYLLYLRLNSTFGERKDKQNNRENHVEIVLTWKRAQFT